jgi:hypothetical protein
VSGILHLLASGSPITGGGGGTYDGFAATRGYVPSDLSGITNANVRTGHWARTDITQLKIAVFNYYSPSEEAPGATMSVTASVEYPAGTLTQILFSASATGTVPNGGTLFSDFCTISIPNGERFWIRQHQTCSAGLVYMSTASYVQNSPVHMGDAYEDSATDLTMTGNIPNSANTISYYPAIIAPTTAPSVLILGDSIDAGVTDLMDVDGSLGIIARTVGPQFGYFIAGLPGETASGFVSNHTQRALLFPFCTHVFVGHGTNDIFAGDSKTTIEGNLATIYGYVSTKTVFGRTIVPRTDSSDVWATTAGQSINSAPKETVRTTLNTDLLVGSAPPGGTFGLGIVNEVAGGKWSTPPATTDDGIHPNYLGYLNEASSGAINTALIGTPATPATETGSGWLDHGSDLTISTRRRTNDTVTRGVAVGNNTVRGAGSNNAGLKIFELEVLQTPAVPDMFIVGLINGTTASGAGLDNYVGNIDDSFGLVSGAGYSFVSGTIFTASSPGAYDFYCGTVIGLAVDFTNKFAYLQINGVWLNGGVPTSGETGTGHVAVWTGTPTLYPGVTLGAGPRLVRLRTVQFLYAPPSGYSAWG